MQELSQADFGEAKRTIVVKAMVRVEIDFPLKDNEAPEKAKELAAEVLDHMDHITEEVRISFQLIP